MVLSVQRSHLGPKVTRKRTL